MREIELENLINQFKTYEVNLQKNFLKEFFIKKTLLRIFKFSNYSNLVFNGGTCLRILYDLPRLSEDIDLDYIKTQININEFAEGLKKFFEKNLNTQINLSIRNKNQTITLKIPILKKYNLVPENPSVSDFLHVKIDIQLNQITYENIITTPYMKINPPFIIQHYDLPTLFSNKLKAIFGRTTKIYHDKYSFKGRDYFDLIWYLQQNIKPNFKLIQYYLEKEQNIKIKNLQDLIKLLDEKIELINEKGLKEDLEALIEDKDFVKEFSNNFKNFYHTLKENLIR